LKQQPRNDHFDILEFIEEYMEDEKECAKKKMVTILKMIFRKILKPNFGGKEIESSQKVYQEQKLEKI
jgi:hypothetical protein